MAKVGVKFYPTRQDWNKEIYFSWNTLTSRTSAFLDSRPREFQKQRCQRNTNKNLVCIGDVPHFGILTLVWFSILCIVQLIVLLWKHYAVHRFKLHFHIYTWLPGALIFVYKHTEGCYRNTARLLEKVQSWILDVHSMCRLTQIAGSFIERENWLRAGAQGSPTQIPLSGRSTCTCWCVSLWQKLKRTVADWHGWKDAKWTMCVVTFGSVGHLEGELNYHKNSPGWLLHHFKQFSFFGPWFSYSPPPTNGQLNQIWGKISIFF